MSEAPKTQFALVITDDGELINNTIHLTPWERRDACVSVLKDACNDVEEEEVTDILDRFGGADPDQVVRLISELYSDFGIDIYLDDQPLPTDSSLNPGVPVLHSVFVDYGPTESTSNSIIHFVNTERRSEHLLQRLSNLGAAPAVMLSEDSLAQKLQLTLRSLVNDQVNVFLISSDFIV